MRPAGCCPACCGAAVACGTRPDTRPGGPVIEDLAIRGNEAISTRTLKKKILTSETGWWPFAAERRLDAAEWQTDLERLRRHYESRGYYEARVVRAEVIPAGEGRVRLVAELHEGPPFRVAAIHVRGLEELARDVRDAVLGDLPLEAGDRFTEPAWAETKARIMRALRDRGHATADLVGEARIDLASDRAVLALAVSPGPTYRFGDIRVRTTPGAAVDAELVREQVALAIGRDRAFSDADLEEAQRRVFAMGVFASARVETGAPDPDTRRVPILVEVREAPFRTVRLGGGLAIDLLRHEARALAGWTDRHFAGRLRRLALQATAGWAFIPTIWAVLGDDAAEGPRHGPIYRITADLEQPRLLGRPSLTLTSAIESERTVEPAFDAIGGRGALGVIWHPRSTWRVLPTYNLEGYHLNGPPAASALTAPLALGCSSDPCFVLLSYLEQQAVWDRRDQLLEPRHGTFLALSLQEGGGAARAQPLGEQPPPSDDRPATGGRAVRIAVEAPRNLWVRGPDVNVELGLAPEFAVNVDGQAQVFGTVNVLRGQVEALGRRFELQDGSLVQFTGPVDAPTLDLKAVHSATRTDLTVEVSVRGTPEDVEVDLRSPERPEYAQGDLLTILATGRSADVPGAASPGASARAVSLLGGVIAERLQGAVLRRLPVDVLNIDPGDGLIGLRFEAGTYVTDDLYVAYVGRFGLDPIRRQNRNEVHLEYWLSERWSFEAAYGDAGRGSADLVWTRRY